VVRVPVHPSAWRKQGKKAYLALLDQTIIWANELDMYVIIDWHSIGNLKSQMFQNNSYYTDKGETNDFWRTVSDALYQVIEPVLRASKVTQGGHATLRYGAHDTPNVREKYIEIKPHLH
jgi:hypothetical protein